MELAVPVFGITTGLYGFSLDDRVMVLLKHLLQTIHNGFLLKLLLQKYRFLLPNRQESLIYHEEKE